ncbi:hypothetical protein T484DRAFT_1935455 [Baffinella frigidus]|nr:hypothetical protein T484DRAFT_1935455 [Cryptophyta sp. CCMP2293]
MLRSSEQEEQASEDLAPPLHPAPTLSADNARHTAWLDMSRTHLHVSPSIHPACWVVRAERTAPSRSEVSHSSPRQAPSGAGMVAQPPSAEQSPRVCTALGP